MSLADEVLAKASARAAKNVFVDVGTGKERVVYSGNDFVQMSQRIVRALEKEGVGYRSRVTVALRNSATFAATVTALLKCGAVFAPMKLEYRAVELTEMFRDLDPDFVITEAEHLESIWPYCDGRVVLVCDGVELHRVDYDQHARASPLYSREGLAELSLLSPRPSDMSGLPPGVASINFTYRGHGYPLGAMIASEQYRIGTKALAECIDADRCHTMLVLLPMTHIYGLVACLFLPLLHDITAVLTHTLHPRRLLQTIRDESIDFLPAVPEIGELLAKTQTCEDSRIGVDLFVTGGSRLTEDCHRRILASLGCTDASDASQTTSGAELLNGYGLTEVTPATLNRRGDARIGTEGTVVHGLEWKLSDTDGELLLRGPGVFRGYYRRPRETNEALDPEGWLHTGDIFSVNQGHLRFVRELKPTCKINGLMVDLQELRAVLSGHDRVEDAHIAFRDGKLRAVVELSEGHSGANGSRPSGDCLRAFLKERLASYKIPQSIELSDR